MLATFNYFEWKPYDKTAFRHVRRFDDRTE